MYNQLSGKIVRTGLKKPTKHYHVKHKGLAHKPDRGVTFWCISIFPINYMSGTYQTVSLKHLHNHVKSMSDYPTIPATERVNFYAAFLKKHSYGNSYIMKNSEIPFEFFYQPALPCFTCLVPTKNDNVTFQQTLKGI